MNAQELLQQHLSQKTQAQAELDATGQLSPWNQRFVQSGYQIVSDPVHPHGKIEPMPDHELRNGLVDFGKMYGAVGLGASALGLGGGGVGLGERGATVGVSNLLGGGGGVGGFLTSPIGASLVGSGISGLANIWATNKQVGANERATQIQADAANHAADLESQANAATLKFLQDQEATRKAEFEKTQAQNYGIYQTRENNLQPYRDWGLGAMAQLGRPIGAA